MYWTSSTLRKPAGSNVDCTVDEMLRFIGKVRYMRAPTLQELKHKIPMWSPCTFKGAYRSKANALQVSAFVVDSDQGFSIFRAAKLMYDTGYRHLLHATVSHDEKEKHKFRVVLPLDKPIPAEDWNIAWDLGAEYWKVLTGSSLDPACKDVSRCYAVHVKPPNAEACVVNVKGGLFPLAALVQAKKEHLAEQKAEESMNTIDLRDKYRKTQQARTLSPAQQHRIDTYKRKVLTPAERQRIAASVGGRITGDVVRGITCPKCSRRSAWFYIDPSSHANPMYTARCNHKNSCNWHGNITEL